MYKKTNFYEYIMLQQLTEQMFKFFINDHNKKLLFCQ